jgi:hypothetical protein
MKAVKKILLFAIFMERVVDFPAKSSASRKFTEIQVFFNRICINGSEKLKQEELLQSQSYKNPSREGMGRTLGRGVCVANRNTFTVSQEKLICSERF